MDFTEDASPGSSGSGSGSDNVSSMDGSLDQDDNNNSYDDNGDRDIDVDVNADVRDNRSRANWGQDRDDDGGDRRAVGALGTRAAKGMGTGREQSRAGDRLEAPHTYQPQTYSQQQPPRRQQTASPRERRLAGMDFDDGSEENSARDYAADANDGSFESTEESPHAKHGSDSNFDFVSQISTAAYTDRIVTELLPSCAKLTDMLSEYGFVVRFSRTDIDERTRYHTKQ
jgi:hypothetical protein